MSVTKNFRNKIISKTSQRLKLAKAIALAGLSLILLASSTASAGVLFEAYAKILSGIEHTGYVIRRIETDNATGEFTLTAYIRTGPTAGNLTESLKAKATKALAPISYTYISTLNGKSTTIDAVFKKGLMTVLVGEGPSEPKKSSKKIGKNTYLSAFLLYSLLQTPQGLKKGNNFIYEVVLEEKAALEKGEALIKGQVDYKSENLFEIQNTLYGDGESKKRQVFINYVSPTGEVLLTKMPSEGVTEEVVASREEAVGTLPFNEKSLKMLFGEVPSGKINLVAKAKEKAGKTSDKESNP